MRMTSHSRINLVRAEPDLSQLEQTVKDAFVQNFGADIIKDVIASKYPETHSVVVFVTKKQVEEMLNLCFDLEEEFENQGFEVSISTREKRS